MIKSLRIQQPITNFRRPLLAVVVLFLVFIACNSSVAFDRYNDGCNSCHGVFNGPISRKGSTFPDDDKHDMHRYTMGTDCNLCHLSGDQKNPYTWQSNGTDDNPGIGCTGCHVELGLRAHHVANGINCHPDDGPPSPENVKPPYYGTVDTLADNTCNDALASNTNENWTIGDFLGLDNDGDNLYDLADFDCGPAYQIAAIGIEGGNVRITWNSVGGRRDMLQSAASLSASFSDVGSALVIPGVGVVSTNAVELSGVTASNRFYRIRYAPAP
jgi:hypothetical protein